MEFIIIVAIGIIGVILIGVRFPAQHQLIATLAQLGAPGFERNECRRESTRRAALFH